MSDGGLTITPELGSEDKGRVMTEALAPDQHIPRVQITVFVDVNVDLPGIDRAPITQAFRMVLLHHACTAEEPCAAAQITGEGMGLHYVDNAVKIERRKIDLTGLASEQPIAGCGDNAAARVRHHDRQPISLFVVYPVNRSG